MSTFAPVTARVFVASTWYETSGMSKREKLYAKCRELISGDRVEMMVETGDVERLYKRLGMEVHK